MNEVRAESWENFDHEIALMEGESHFEWTNIQTYLDRAVQLLDEGAGIAGFAPATGASGTLRLDVVAGGVRTTLFEHELNPTLAFGDRRWFEVDAPLGAWAGREVALELSTEAERPEAQLLLRGGWERPRRVRAGAAADLPEPEVALER